MTVSGHVVERSRRRGQREFDAASGAKSTPTTLVTSSEIVGRYAFSSFWDLRSSTIVYGGGTRGEGSR